MPQYSNMLQCNTTDQPLTNYNAINPQVTYYVDTVFKLKNMIATHYLLVKATPFIRQQSVVTE